MEVQLLGEKYIFDLLELYKQLLPRENIIYSSEIESLIESINSDNNYYIIIGIVDGHAVATCSLIIIPNITHDLRPYAIVENVVTHECYRNKGYGSHLLEYAKHIAEKNNCHKIMVQTRRKEEKVFEFYRKAGFHDDVTKGFLMNLQEDV